MINVAKIEKNTLQAVALLKALSNEKRLAIICSIYNEEKSVGELEDIIGLSQSALSQHLARLRKDKLVKTRRQAQTIYYSLNGLGALSILECLNNIYDITESKKKAASK